MKKLFISLLALVGLVLSPALPAAAQGMPQIQDVPQDPNLRIGHLDNGLTYYIRHNETPKGQADFFIAQKVGSILEEENQRGLAHFLEHMCFNGTTNFPDKNIINWLETKGVKFGANLNAYTSIDETVYNISNVPVADKNVQDSCLLILHDWACDLTLDPKEIDAERGVIHEEWRQSNVGQMRLMTDLLPVIYAGNKYGERLPIGTMEVVDNFPPQALIDYYHTWYRPDQQGIIVVGDIDPDYIEQKIIEIFSPIKMPENAKEREYLTIEDTDETIYAIGKDKELQVAQIYYMAKNDNAQLPREYRNTDIYLANSFVNHMVESMFQSRIDELTNNPETEFAAVGLGIGEFFISKTKGAVTMRVIPKDTDVVPAFAQAYRELMRAAKTGFTVGEYERAKAEYLANMQKQYDSRDNRQNGSFSREYVRLFVDNEAAPGIEYELEKAKFFAQMISVDVINQQLPTLLSDDDNRVLLAMIPDAEGFAMPTEEQFASTIETINEEELEPYKDEMREDPLIPNLPKAGTIVSTTHSDEWDATEYTLSNGVKVIVKPTEFKNDQIVFEAIAKGKGSATIKPELASTVKYLDYAISSYALNDYSNSDLKKYLQGKNATVGVSMDAYNRGMSGNATVKDLPVLMELIYSFFTGFNLKEDEFEATRSSIAGILANQEKNPQFIFSKVLMKSLFSAPARQALSVEDVKAADRQASIDIIRNIYENAADFTFVFVGKIDLDTFIPLMEQYIATLPADQATATTTYTTDPGFEVAVGNATDVFTTKMETPQTWVFIGVEGSMPYTAKNKLLASIAGQVLSKRLLNKIREEMGAVYSIGASGYMSRLSDMNTMFQTAFPMKPEEKENVLNEIHAIFEACTNDVTADEIKPALEYLAKNNAEELEENTDWAQSITATTLNGVQTFLNVKETLDTITPEDVMNFLRQVLDQNNYRTVILDPAIED